jgi:hypothetical protein
MTTSPHAPRSLPARYPPHGAWPLEMRADMAAALLGYDTTGQLYAAVARSEAPRPTATRQRKHKREPVWALDACRKHVDARHQIASDAAAIESIGDLI